MAIVYSSADRTRFFIVPDGVKLRAGGMRVQALTGEQLRVDGAELAPFEVPEAQARKYVEERLSAIEVLRLELVAFADALRTLGRELEREAPPERVAALLKMAGVTTADLSRDPTGSLEKVIARVTEATMETLEPILKRSPS